MVQPGDSGKGDDVARTRRLDGARDRRITVERHMGAVLVVVARGGSNQSQQMALAEYDDMIEHLTPECADKSFGVAVLPGRPRRALYLADAEMVHTRIERATVDPVPIADQASDPGVEADGFDDLLRGPGLVGMAGDVHVQEPPPFKREHEEYVQQPESHRRHHQEVDGDRARQVGADEGPPRRRRWLSRSASRLRHIPGDGVLVDVVAHLGQLARDAPPPPQRVFVRHPFNQRNDPGVERRPPDPPRLAGPESGKSMTMPGDDGGRLDDDQGVNPARPTPGAKDP